MKDNNRITIRHPRKREFFSKLALAGDTAQRVLGQTIDNFLEEKNMERTEAVVLDQFGEPWGLVDTIENNGTEIGVFCEKAKDGCPVNVKYRKISRARKSFEHFERFLSEPVYFSEYKFNGQSFFEYSTEEV